MRLHLDPDRDEPLVWEELVRLEPAAVGPDLLLEIGAVEVHGRVDRVDPEFLVAMDLVYAQELACIRCLQPVRSEVSTHAEILVKTRPREARARYRNSRDTGANARVKGSGGEEEIELEEGDLEVLVLAGEELETEPLIVEQILLEVPMKPLCRPDCLGLCPRCGADRNVTPDCCPEVEADERLEALGALRDRLSAEGP